MIPKTSSLDKQTAEGQKENIPASLENKIESPMEIPNVPFPCWKQSWDCGNWFPLSEQPESSSYFITDVANRDMAKSSCDICSSIRLIDFKNREVRVVLSRRGKIRNCDHIWRASGHAWSLDDIEPEDLILILYKKSIHVVVIDEMPMETDTAVYRIAEVKFDNAPPKSIDLANLKWNKRQAKEEIPFADQTLPICMYILTKEDKSEIRHVLSLWYDFYYGGPPARATKEKTPAHIAIVHKRDLGKESNIDLAKFRFKTWEDGLGNICDSNEPIYGLPKEG